MERIRRAADLYAALTNAEHAYWADFDPETRAHLEALLLFGVTQFRPVALAAMETRDPKTVAKVLHMLMVISFRYTIVSNLGTGNLEQIYARGALAIREGKASSAKEVFHELRGAYVDDTRFADDFGRRVFTKASVARYVLAAINDKLEADPEKTVAERTGRITLEHILPKRPGTALQGSVPEDRDPEEFVDLIGNLTLLEKGKNRGISNAGFHEKKDKAFKSSTLHLNKSLGEAPSWDHREIERRSAELAKVAVKIWRLDF